MVKDITGQRFGRLVAQRSTEERRLGVLVWECKCDCGNTAYVPKSYLLKGGTRSCGCMRWENALQNGINKLVGQRFGRLVAMKATDKRRNRQIVWECKCDCGNIVYASSGQLTNGRITACSSCAIVLPTGSNAKDLTGQRFGRLVAAKPTEERKNGYVMWECRCDCGNMISIRTSSLTSGNGLSCGCLRKERNQKD